jgi:hypothetical protein
VEGAIVPVVGAIVPVAVVGAVADEVEEEVAVEGDTMEMVFCLLIGCMGFIHKRLQFKLLLCKKL